MISTLKFLIRERSLPLFVTRQDKFIVSLAVFAGAAVLYLLSNHCHFIAPQELPRSWIDFAVPFLPNSLWIYLSEYFFFIAIYLAADDMINFNKYLYSFFVLQVVSCLIFAIWPTTYPRDLFPLPDNLNAVTHYAFSSLRKADSPANCCPSLHVSSVYLSAFIYLDEKRHLFPLFFIWASAIAASTLTTKQHYLVDVIAGLLMAAAHYWFFHRYMTYKSAINN
jgi:membrane-associated phospholipid phosphatase